MQYFLSDIDQLPPGIKNVSSNLLAGKKKIPLRAFDKRMHLPDITDEKVFIAQI